MKVFEKINKLKGTNATIYLIANWFYENRIYPHNIIEDNALELDKIPNWLKKVCSKFDSEVFMNGYDSLMEMLDYEIDHKEKERCRK